MPEIVLSVPNIDTPILLLKEKLEWVSKSNYKLKFESINEENGDFKISEKDERIGTDGQYLLELFVEKYLDWQKNQLDKQFSGIETDDEDDENSIIPKPDFDPEQIRVDPKVFSLIHVFNNIQKNRIDLSPDFQRHFVWKEVEKKSRLIESLLLRIPLPMFYLAENDEGLYQVVDGVQRLSTIRDFMSNKLILKELEYLIDCEGKTFDTLAPKYQRRLEDTQFSFNIIAPTTPASVKTEIFKRLNLGGKPLNRQEIRNSLAKPETRDLINRMAESQYFKVATNFSIKSLRMEDQELVMRFVAFYLRSVDKITVYKGDMEGYLDEALDYLNGKDAKKIFPLLENDFYNSMQNAFHLFGKYAFRKVTLANQEKNQKPPINKSLFTVWSILLVKYPYDFMKEKARENIFIEILPQRLAEDKEYFDALTTGTSQVNKLDYSFKIANEIIKDNLIFFPENA